MNLADIVRGAKVAALLAIIVAVGGCSGSGGSSTSSPSQPVVESMSASGLPAPRGGTLKATVVAKSPQGLALAYSWKTSGSGWVITGGATSAKATITAPDSYSGTGTAAVTVTDSEGHTASGKLSLSTVDNEVPVINSLSVSPQPVITSANLAASATDPDGDPLTYAWNVGGIANLLTGPNAVWNSTGIPGNYGVTVTADDGFGGTASASTTMVVSSASPWPRYQRDLGSTGLSPVDTSADTGVAKLIFSSSTSYTASGATIGADGTIYMGSSDGNLYALNPSGVGNPKWKFTTGGAVFSTPAVGADGTIYFGSEDDNLYAVNPDGTLKWKFTTGGTIKFSSPAIGADGTIYIGSSDLYAINPDGSEKWHFTAESPVPSPPVIAADGTVYFSAQNNLYAFNPDGTEKWSYPVSEALNCSLASTSGIITIYAESGTGILYALNADGSLKWQSPGLGTGLAPAVGSDGTVYFGSKDDNLYAINPADGSVRWKYTTGDSIFVPPAIGADGTVYALSDDGSLYAINPDGSKKWSAAIGAPSGFIFGPPTIGADGAIYVGWSDGNVYAVH